MDWQAIALSVELALYTTVILMVIAVPVGAWLAYNRNRWRISIEALVALPLVLPPTVLGYYLLVAMGPNSPVGQIYQAVTGQTLAFSFQGLLIASVLYSVPFAVQPIAAGFASVDPRLIEASWTAGVSRLATVIRVAVPLSIPGLITGAVLSFAHTIGEFGVALMVGGNIPGKTRTVSISIYDSVQSFDYAVAGRTSLLLLVFSFVVLAVTYSAQRRFSAVQVVR